MSIQLVPARISFHHALADPLVRSSKVPYLGGISRVFRECYQGEQGETFYKDYLDRLRDCMSPRMFTLLIESISVDYKGSHRQMVQFLFEKTKRNMLLYRGGRTRWNEFLQAPFDPQSYLNCAPWMNARRREKIERICSISGRVCKRITLAMPVGMLLVMFGNSEKVHEILKCVNMIKLVVNNVVVNELIGSIVGVFVGSIAGYALFSCKEMAMSIAKKTTVVDHNRILRLVNAFESKVCALAFGCLSMVVAFSDVAEVATTLSGLGVLGGSLVGIVQGFIVMKEVARLSESFGVRVGNLLVWGAKKVHLL